MGTERNDSARREAEQRERRELLASLHEAVDALSVCLERLHLLIDRVESRPASAVPRTQVSFGGGPSVLGGREPESPRGPELRPDRAFEREFGEREFDQLAPERGRATDSRWRLDAVTRRPARSDRFEGGGGGRGDRFERTAHYESSGHSQSGDHTFHDDTRGFEDRRAGGEPRAGRGRPRGEELRPVGTPELMAVSEMVHLGYSREEIAERLHTRWGDQAAAILREALD